MANLDKVVQQICNYILESQNEASGFLPHGHNGPYRDIETPIRNTCHAIVILCAVLRSFDLSQDKTENINKALVKSLEALLRTEEFFDYKINLYKQRESKKKDAYNGVIGAAWVLEALAIAFQITEQGCLRERIRERIGLIVTHFESQKTFKWKYLNSGRWKVDRTFNHQLWLFYALYLAKKVTGQSVAELDSYELKRSVIFEASGLVCHPLNFTGIRYLGPLISLYYRRRQKGLRLKEVGYHSFNVLALSRVTKLTNNESFSRAFNKAIDYVNSGDYKSLVRKSKYSLKYNNPYIELYSVADKLTPKTYDWWSNGLCESLNVLDRHISGDSMGYPDVQTSIFRIYEMLIDYA